MQPFRGSLLETRLRQQLRVKIEKKIFGLMTKCIMCSTCGRLGVGGVEVEGGAGEEMVLEIAIVLI